MQGAVHGNLFLAHEHFLVQEVRHPHLTSSKTAFGAGGNKQPCGKYVFPSTNQPLSSKLRRLGFGVTYDLSLIYTKLARMICGSKVPTVGGSISPSRFLDRNISHRRVDRDVGPLAEYPIHTNLSKGLKCHGRFPSTNSDFDSSC